MDFLRRLIGQEIADLHAPLAGECVRERVSVQCRIEGEELATHEFSRGGACRNLPGRVTKFARAPQALDPGDPMFTTLPPDRLNALAQTYARDGMVRVAGVLADHSAAELQAGMRERGDWLQVFNSGDQLFELDRNLRAGLAPDKQSELDNAIYAGARSGFQYRYESIRIPDSESARRASADPLVAVARELSGAPMLDALKQITGAQDIQYADAQGTAYSPGDFLTGHDDSFEGKNRRAAYVLSLTPVWRLEWGGLLMMHGDDGESAQGHMPLMNVLTIFRVGQMHSVSEVSKAAAYRRYSITGWLRAEPQPE
jgi:SM-20-related protein